MESSEEFVETEDPRGGSGVLPWNKGVFSPRASVATGKLGPLVWQGVPSNADISTLSWEDKGEQEGTLSSEDTGQSCDIEWIKGGKGKRI